MNLFSKQHELLKPELQKTYFVWIVSQNFDKPNLINIESIILYTRSFVKVLSFTKIFSSTFSEPIKTRMRKNDKIKRRSTQLFILVHSLSLEKLIQLSNPNPN